MKNVLKIGIIAAIMLAILFGIFNYIIKKSYPKKYSEVVECYAKEYEVDSLLIYAIMKAESKFEENIVSSKGAVGLMQIMPATAEEIANEIGKKDFKTENLKDIETNISFGIRYFSNLLKRYNNNYLLALAAYNAGIGNVEEWINRGIIRSDGTDIENIPFKETNMYIRKILRDYEIYKKLY